MKKTPLLLVPLSVIGLSLFLSACSSTNGYRSHKAYSANDEYVQVIDHEKIALVAKANRYSPAFVKTFWVNYPTKRVKKSELEKSK